MHLESAAVSPGAKGLGLGGHQASRSRGLAAIRYDPQDTQPSDIDLWQREIIVRGRPGKPGRPSSLRRTGQYVRRLKSFMRARQWATAGTAARASASAAAGRV